MSPKTIPQQGSACWVLTQMFDAETYGKIFTAAAKFYAGLAGCAIIVLVVLLILIYRLLT